jgi:hypothetical protein
MWIIELWSPGSVVEAELDLGAQRIAITDRSLWWLGGVDATGAARSGHPWERDAVLDVSVVRSFFGLGSMARLAVRGFVAPDALDGRGVVFGQPMLHTEAARAARWLAERLQLPRTPPTPRVIEPALIAARARTPPSEVSALHGVLVEVTAVVSVEHESRRIAGAWLSVATRSARRALERMPLHSAGRCVVVGQLHARTQGGYGHMGASACEIVASEIRPG